MTKYRDYRIQEQIDKSPEKKILISFNDIKNKR